jgi:UDP-N-acetylmuramate dehydrogenase
MNAVHDLPETTEHAPVSTWFGVGGTADRLVRPSTISEITACVRSGLRCRVLGDGANLLVADAGVDGLVIDLARLNNTAIDTQTGVVRAEAGTNLPKLITRTARAGLEGLEVLAGIPASVGGAAVMNAGGKFGSIADSIRAVEIIDAGGNLQRCSRDQIPFAYRHSGLSGVVVAVEFALTPADPASVRERLKSCMAYKKDTQPLASDSAGCCFRNPELTEPLDGIGGAGQRVSAGLLLDRSGCKGLRRGGVVVSHEHANFVVAEAGATATDVVDLLRDAANRVFDRFGVRLDREVVVWNREGQA